VSQRSSVVSSGPPQSLGLTETCMTTGGIRKGRWSKCSNAHEEVPP